MARTIDIKKIEGSTIVTELVDGIKTRGVSSNSVLDIKVSEYAIGLDFKDNQDLTVLDISHDNLTSATNSLIGGEQSNSLDLIEAFSTAGFFQ